jgi:dihydrofolate reductase
MTVNIIYAQAENGIIGRNNRMPWHIKEDLKHFYELTKGHVVIMGINTWNSLPGKTRPLADRTNVVLTSDTTTKIQGAIIHNSLDAALEAYKDQEVWIIGGGKVLRQAFKKADHIYLTQIHGNVAGDVVAPRILVSDWIMTDKSLNHKSTIHTYHYVKYNKRTEPLC